VIAFAPTVTAEAITDEQIKALRESLLSRPRQNAYTRAIRKDCDAALGGDRCCRESVAAAWNKVGGRCPHGCYLGHCATCSGIDHYP